MTACYVVFDPQHAYAIAMIEAIYRRYQLKPICIYPRSGLTHALRQRSFPLLRSDRVLDAYFLDRTPLTQLGALLRRTYQVVGAVLHQPRDLPSVSRLLDALQLPWNSAAVLQRFNDKHALKSYLRHAHPHLPVTASRLVRSAAEVFAEPRPERFVLKPAQGSDNRLTAYFDDRSSRDAVAAVLQQRRGHHWILEEHLEGPEFCVAGQMDETGHARLTAVMRRQECPNGTRRMHHVPRSADAFAPLEGYVTALMQATELRRAAFHATVVLTGSGPRLLGARPCLPGRHLASMNNLVHGGRLDVFEAAAHHHLFATPYGGGTGDWAHYDRIRAMQLEGHTAQRERLVRIEGMAQVAARPEFVRWTIKPQLGSMLQPTVDEQSVPYALQLRSFAGDQALGNVADWVQRVLLLNRTVSRPRRLGVTLLRGMSLLYGS